MSFYIFSKDLKDLYFRIGISGVEDLYIKCAQAYTKSLSRWLLENDNIKKSLNIPGVYDALSFLRKEPCKFSLYPFSNPISSNSFSVYAI